MTWPNARAFCYGKSQSKFIEVYDEQELDALRAIAGNYERHIHSTLDL